MNLEERIHQVIYSSAAAILSISGVLNWSSKCFCEHIKRNELLTYDVIFSDDRANPFAVENENRPLVRWSKAIDEGS
jgi:hypothetical protein